MATKECHFRSHDGDLIVIRVHVLIVVLVIFMLTLWTILADTSDNGLLDLGPLATDVGGFVVVASTGG